MKKFFSKIAVGLSAATLAGTLLAPAAFAVSDVDISGNGAHSNNSVTIVSSTNCTVEQKSKTAALTEVKAVSDTGNVQANGNTGGDVMVSTGDASTTVAVVVSGGSNEATNPCCGCVEPNGLNSAVISGNGAHSTNTETVVSSNSKNVKQKSKTFALTGVLAKAKTGKIRTNHNTGTGGLVSATTGNGTTDVTVAVSGGNNTLNP